jgi:hypothetical protein
MSHFAAVLDANVLYSYPLTSVLLELAEARLYRPIWSADIHQEWIRAVRSTKPDFPPEKLERCRAARDEALPDACVGGYRKLIPSLDLPDAGDKHVLAAAIRAKAQVIETFNEKHFPDAALAEFDLTVQHPDTFLRHLIDLAPGVVRECVSAMLARFKNPPLTIEEFIAVLERQSLPESAAALRELFGSE